MTQPNRDRKTKIHKARPSATQRVLLFLYEQGGGMRFHEVCEALGIPRGASSSKAAHGISQCLRCGFATVVDTYKAPGNYRESKVVAITDLGREYIDAMGLAKKSVRRDMTDYPPGWKRNPMPEGAPPWLK